MNNSGEINQQAVLLQELLIYRDITAEPLIRPLLAPTSGPHHFSYAGWFGALLEQYPDAPNPWSALLRDAVLGAENHFSLACERGGFAALPIRIKAAVLSDLRVLSKLSQWHPGSSFALDPPRQETVPAVIREDAPESKMEWLARYYAEHGAGRLGRYSAFIWRSPSGCFAPVAFPDPITFANLIGNAYQKGVLLQNTRQFLQGLPANNVLLYGDRGTGKSSAIKAVGNEFAAQGLRLIEVNKDDLADFPDIIAQLRQRGLKFLIYVDDLSFETSETQYKHLKAVLEGGVEAKAANVLIYATSNRRHLIRETFEAREAEIHGNDAVQEQLSLADRFGVTLTFMSPDQEEYLAIVRGLAEQRGIDLAGGILAARAIEWERRQNGRSGRTARQFIDHLQGELGLNSQ